MSEKYCLLSCTNCGAQFNCTKQKQHSLTNSVAEIGNICPLCGKGVVEYHKYAAILRSMDNHDTLFPEGKEDEK